MLTEGQSDGPFRLTTRDGWDDVEGRVGEQRRLECRRRVIDERLDVFADHRPSVQDPVAHPWCQLVEPIDRLGDGRRPTNEFSFGRPWP